MQNQFLSAYDKATTTGSNVRGWEDTLGGGDRDYNDLSRLHQASGHGWLV